MPVTRLGRRAQFDGQDPPPAVEVRSGEPAGARPALTTRGLSSFHMEGCVVDVGGQDAGAFCIFDDGGEFVFKDNTIVRIRGTAIRLFRDGLCIALGTNAQATFANMVE
jgi:hypothetical protein